MEEKRGDPSEAAFLKAQLRHETLSKIEALQQQADAPSLKGAVELHKKLKEAMKAGDASRRSTIGMILASVKNRELEKRSKLMKASPAQTGGTPESEVESASELTDEEILEAVASEAKKRRESIETYEQAQRPELAAQEKAELEILMRYLPAQLSDEEIRTVVREVVAQVHPSGPKDMGKVLGQVMPRVKGRAEGSRVSEIVKQEIVAA